MSHFKNMLKITTVSILVMITNISSAAILSIDLDQGAFVNNGNSPNVRNTNYYPSNNLVQIGSATQYYTNYYYALFGFDVSQLNDLTSGGQDLVINSITFNLFHFSSSKNGILRMVVGDNARDSWDQTSVTANQYRIAYDPYSVDPLGGIPPNANTVGKWLSWDISALNPGSLSNDYLTLAVFDIDPYSGLNTFSINPNSNQSYISFDYDLVPSAVPEPPTFILMILGMVGIARFQMMQKGNQYVSFFPSR